VSAVATAFGASIFAGLAIGAFGATRRWLDGVRPRSIIRRHLALFEGCTFLLTTVAVAVASVAVSRVDSTRLTLAVSSAAVAALVAVASWLVLVERDDDGDLAPSPEPNWWPQFERELDDWNRARRTPLRTR